MFAWLRRVYSRWVIGAAFAALKRADGQWSQVKGPGMLPLPWKGPHGEIVLVKLGQDGRMTDAPLMCVSPRDMMRAMELQPPPSSLLPLTLNDTPSAQRMVS